jgi:hypothetical protein
VEGISDKVLKARDALLRYQGFSARFNWIVLGLFVGWDGSKLGQEKKERIWEHIGPIRFRHAMPMESMCEFLGNEVRKLQEHRDKARASLTDEVVTALEIGGVALGIEVPHVRYHAFEWPPEAIQKAAERNRAKVYASTFHTSLLEALENEPFIASLDSLEAFAEDKYTEKEAVAFTSEIVEERISCPFISSLQAQTEIRLEAARGFARFGFPSDSDMSKQITWLTVSDAARRLAKELDNTISFEGAKSDIHRKCNAGVIDCHGQDRERRINPESLDSYILGRRNRVLNDNCD